MEEKRLAVLKEKPNNPLIISLVITILAGVIVCCLIAQEAAEKGTKSEFANYLFFSMLFLAGGIVLMWKQVQRIDRKLDAITELMPVQIEDDLQELEDDSDEESDEDEDEDDEEEEKEKKDEDDDDNDDDDEDDDDDDEDDDEDDDDDDEDDDDDDDDDDDELKEEEEKNGKNLSDEKKSEDK